ncbi:MAG: glycosyl hydrolase, partial [Bacteroidota bacterium]
TWENMGLKDSEHISKIVVHPDNSNVIWAAVQGPLWSKGGERGLYKSTDGGKNWIKTLGDDEWVGVTDMVIDPRNPQRLYAATWQRHRNVAAYMGGGPGTALYKSEDGGDTWIKLKKGLPTSNMGKIGLTISPQNPDILYAAIELDRRTGAVYRSANRGASWEKRSNAVSGATGPHYYQELYASPHKFERLYLMDVRIQVSEDGGKTFRILKEEDKHSDNHAIAFRADDPDYLLIGTDGGLYESFDLAENWRFSANLPTLQYYKVAVDDAEPFYTIYGGTQDNNSHVGPSRTDNVHGIRNADWRITLFADGHQSATEPGNPDIAYAEWQEGNLVRVDRTNGEIVYIQPQPEEGEGPERFNWDSPILVSPHKPTRLYFASQRVWKSENRGDSWTAISEDLTRDQDRITLPIMGNTQSWDAPWDFLAMSNYNTITSLAESPQQEGLVYAGTDDGIIQVTEDGGQNWRKIMVSALPGVPATAFVNDIKADLYDANTVYVVLDNHKYGDFKPYLYKSTNKGQTWQAMSSNLPDRTLLWRIVQDHEKSGLMFLATEFGIYFTVNGGGEWTQMKGGLPTISFRDLVIQKRENDLVCASFGRGFYILDDYSPLREVSDSQMQEEATLFASRKAWWYIQQNPLGGGKRANQGAGYYVADNPPFGAVFTYYLKDGYKSLGDVRKEKEKKMSKEGQAASFPGWDAIEKERMEAKPQIWLTVTDQSGEVVRKLKGPAKKGIHRVAWDLTRPSASAISLNTPPRPQEEDGGWMVGPGTYTVTLSKEINGVISQLSDPQTFEVVPMRKGALSGASPQQVAAFWKSLEDMDKQLSATRLTLRKSMNKVKAMQIALNKAQNKPGELEQKLYSLRMKMMEMDVEMNGNRSKQQVGEKNAPTIQDRIGTAQIGTFMSTYGPTPMHKRSLEIAQKQLAEIKKGLAQMVNQEIPTIEKALLDAGAPWVEGQAYPIGEK